MCGDATNQEACDKEKLHISAVTPCVVHMFQDEQRFQFTKSVCDCQVVKEGTCHELFHMAQRELKSIHCPTWIERRDEELVDEQGNRRRLTLFQFGFDAGPENTRMTKMVRTIIKDSPWVMMRVNWRRMHQSHLIVKQLLGLIDDFDKGPFWDRETFEFEAWTSLPEHTTVVSNVSSAWRCPGSVRALNKAGTDQLTALVWSRVGNVTPGRLVRGRWGSIDGIEKI